MSKERIMDIKELLALIQTVDTTYMDSKSDISPLFIGSYDEYDQYYFNDKNWNSGQDIIRHISLTLWDMGKKEYVTTLEDDTKIILRTKYDSDDWTCYIVINKPDNSFVILTEAWYKHRGSTENITIDGRQAVLGEYMEIINLLIHDDLLYNCASVVINKAREYLSTHSMCEYEKRHLKKVICAKCAAEYQMKYGYCCLNECNEHDFCIGCDKGINLKKE